MQLYFVEYSKKHLDDLMSKYSSGVKAKSPRSAATKIARYLKRKFSDKRATFEISKGPGKLRWQVETNIVKLKPPFQVVERNGTEFEIKTSVEVNLERVSS